MSKSVLVSASLLFLALALSACTEPGVCLEQSQAACRCPGGVPGVSRCSSGTWGACQCVLSTDVEWPDVPDLEPELDTEDAEETTLLAYRYVRISDLSMTVTSPSGGADMDALLLDTGETTYFADQVEYFRHGGGYQGAELEAILGPPDAFAAYPDVSRCNIERGFLSLGGLGGEVIIRLAGPLKAGDTLTLLEVGNCNYGSGIAISDEYQVTISHSPSLGGNWFMLGNGRGPESSFIIPPLP